MKPKPEKPLRIEKQVYWKKWKGIPYWRVRRVYGPGAIVAARIAEISNP